MSDRIGIAFVGGGGKGAYQIGVWKALKETGLDKQVVAVSGTSVGALNASMYVQGDYQRAENIWKNLSPSHILNWSLGLKSVSTSKNLEELIRRSIDINCFDRSDINCWITAWTKENSPISFTIPSSDNGVVKFTTGNAHYFNIRSYSDMERIKILLASAALPIVFPPQDVDNNQMRDGGLIDNVPVKPLYEIEKCSIIIVVHLNQSPTNHDTEVNKTEYPNASVIEIWPKNPQGDTLSGTLDFVSQHACRRINQGYSETIDLFRDIVSCQVKAASSDKQVETFSNLIREKISSNAEIYDNMKNLTQKWSTDELVKLQQECLALMKENSHRKLQIRDIRSGSLAKILPRLVGNQYEINRVLMLIQQIAVDRIDLLQCEINAQSLWIDRVEAKADFSIYMQSCSSKCSEEFDNTVYSKLPLHRKIILLAYDIANILRGMQELKEEWLKIICKNMNLPEKFSLRKFFSALQTDNTALELFINKKFDYNNADISSFVKIMYAMFAYPGLTKYNDNTTIETHTMIRMLYLDYIELNYRYSCECANESTVVMESRNFTSLLEKRDNPNFTADHTKLKIKYNNSVHRISTPAHTEISQQCYDYIATICKNVNFCNTINNDNKNDVLEKLGLENESILLFHDDSSKEQILGFAVTDDGIHSYIDYKRQDRFIPFSRLANITAFQKHTHVSPTNTRRFIEVAAPKGQPCLPILPYEKITVDAKQHRSDVIIEFLTKIRNACWVDLYL